MEVHDSEECEDCQVNDLDVNGHEMQVIVPCYEPRVVWLCVTCDSIEDYPLTDDREAVVEMIQEFMQIHCLDLLRLKV